MKHMGEILPVDGYYVQLNQSLPVDYLNALIHLYQPLIGMNAVGLYQTLLLEIELQAEVDLQTHHTLMSYLNMPLDKIYENRQKLEGIGLLKSFKKETEELTYFTYELMIPFRPREFFQDVMLSELLYHHIGESKFLFLKNHYCKAETRSKGEEKTVPFHEVFQTFTPKNEAPNIIVHRDQTAEIPVLDVDFTFIKQGLERQLVPVEKVLTETNRRVIAQLMELYQLETYEIEKSVLWALTDENLLDIEQLIAACHDLFQAKHNVSDIQLVPKQVKVENKLPENTPKRALTKMEEITNKFEVISPKQLLEDLSSGNNASEQDMKLVSEVMVSQGLPAPVVNVLIHYVMLQSNMRLSKAYFKTIASNWSRQGFTTAKEAMDFVEEQTSPAPKKQGRNYRKGNQSKEIIPDWFKAQKEQDSIDKPEVKDQGKTQQQVKEEAEMLAILEKYGSK